MVEARGSRRPSIVVIAGVVALLLLCLTAQATTSTTAGYVAQIANSTNTAGTASNFTCTGAVGVDKSSAVFAYKLSDPSTTTTSSPATTYEAESANLSGGASTATEHNGYSGSGFVGGYTDSFKGTAQTVFTVAATTAATYVLALRYANGTGSQTLSLQLDGGTPQQLTLPTTGSWDSWAFSTSSVTWSANSTHTVAFNFGTGDTGNVNLDYLYVTAGDQTNDSFTGTTGTTLQTHAGEVAATWTKQAILGSNDDAVLTNAGRLRKSTNSYAALYTASAVPAKADYSVSADIQTLSVVTQDIAGVVGRVDTTVANGTFYVARYERSTTSFRLYRVVSGSYTLLGASASISLGVSSTYRLTLDMTGSTIRLLVNGAQQVTATDSAITAAGVGGVALGFANTGSPVSTTITDSTGMQLDNFIATPTPTTVSAATTAAAEYTGNNAPGVYQGAMTTSATTPLACPRDVGTAYVLDGSTSAIYCPTSVSNPQTFSIEIWFKSTVASGKLVGFGTAATGASAQYDRHLYFSTTGQLIFGIYSGANNTITTPSVYTDGVWHQAIATLSSSTGAALYVDGKLAVSSTAYTSAENDTGYWRIGYDKTTGWLNAGSNDHFTGSLRFAAVYNTVLSASQVTAHYAAGR